MGFNFNYLNPAYDANKAVDYLSGGQLSKAAGNVNNPLLNSMGIGGSSSNQVPQIPDYTKLAQWQANANRVNQVTPYGSLNYTNPNPNDPNSPWTATTTLSPQQQQLLNQSSAFKSGLMNMASGYMPQLQNALNSPVTMKDLPASMVNPGQTGQDALMARFQPMIDQSNKALDQQLANQGIMPGSEAYNNAWRAQNQSNNDLRTQAALNGINVGQQAQQQQYNLLTGMQSQPFNLMNALTSGVSVQNPSFTSTPAGPDYTGAAQNTYNAQLGNYNAQQAQQNALMGGLFNLGSAYLMSPPGF